MCAVGATHEAHVRLRSMPSYNFQAGGVLIDVPSNALDIELMQLHATITRLWLEIGERSVKHCFDEARR